MTEPANIPSDAVVARYVAGARDFRGFEIDDPPSKTPFVGACLDGSDFSGAFIVADFSRASLRGVRFVEANVKTCVFAGADLTGADFSGAALCATTFAGARLEGAMFEGAHCYGKVFGPHEVPDF